MEKQFESFVGSVRKLYGSLITGRFLVCGAAVFYMHSTRDFNLERVNDVTREYVRECINIVDGRVWTMYSNDGNGGV